MQKLAMRVDRDPRVVTAWIRSEKRPKVFLSDPKAQVAFIEVFESPEMQAVLAEADRQVLEQWGPAK